MTSTRERQTRPVLPWRGIAALVAVFLICLAATPIFLDDSGAAFGIPLGIVAIAGLAATLMLAAGSHSIIARWTAVLGGLLLSLPALFVVWIFVFYVILDAGN